MPLLICEIAAASARVIVTMPVSVIAGMLSIFLNAVVLASLIVLTLIAKTVVSLLSAGILDQVGMSTSSGP